MTLRMQVMQLMLLLVLVTTVRASPEHRVSFSEDYNSQLLPPTEVNKWETNVSSNCQNIVSFPSFVGFGLLTDLKFNGVNKNILL